MSNWPTTIYTFLTLSTQWMSSPLRKWGLMVSSRFYHISRNRRQGESKIPNTSGGKLLCRPSSSHKRLLDRVPFGIIYVASAKSPSTREASHQPVFTNSCLTISYTRLPCLPSRWISPGCSINPFNSIKWWFWRFLCMVWFTSSEEVLF